MSSIDYLQAYKKFTYVTQEKYSLDHIAFVELGERKKENPGRSFKDFYTNHWNVFVDYNRHDAILVDKLEDKLKLIELMVTIAYMAKINVEDVFSPVGTWDNIIYNYMKEKNIIIPVKKDDVAGGSYEGAYVKDPLVGFHEWIMSFDLNSLYPSLIMQYNISPETITNHRFDVTVDQLLKRELPDNTRQFLIDNNLTMTANGYCFRKDIKGFLPALMETYYADRSKYKKEMLKYEQEYQHNKSNDLSKMISRLYNLQMALKILLNSCYGALANTYFRYFDLRLAEGITLSGQLSLRWASDGIDRFLNETMKTDNYPYVLYNDTDSVVGNSIITINGNDIKISEFYDSCDNDFIKYDDFNNNYVKRVKNCTTPSLSTEGTLEHNSVTYVMKHTVAKEMFRITNKLGESVIVTSDHSIIVKDKKTGEIMSIPPKKLDRDCHCIINIR